MDMKWTKLRFPPLQPLQSPTFCYSAAASTAVNETCITFQHTAVAESKAAEAGELTQLSRCAASDRNVAPLTRFLEVLHHVPRERHGTKDIAVKHLLVDFDRDILKGGTLATPGIVH